MPFGSIVATIGRLTIAYGFKSSERSKPRLLMCNYQHAENIFLAFCSFLSMAIINTVNFINYTNSEKELAM